MNLTDKYINKNFLQDVENFDLDELIEFSKTVRVLLVFPDDDLRSDILGVFKIFFHDIDIVSAPKDGIEYFDTHKYDLVVSCDKFENSNAQELMDHIRHISRNVSTIILLDNDTNFLHYVKLNIDAYFTIPIDVKLFVAIMQKLLNSLLYKERYYNYQKELESIIEEKTKELQEINKNLEQRVKEEVLKSTDFQEKLFQQSKLASLGEMISNIAHQWRQPLSIISTLSTSMQVGLELGLEETLEEKIKKLTNITNQTQYLSATINTFSEFIKEDKIFINANLTEKIHQAKILTEPNLNEAKITLIDNVDYNSNPIIETVKGELPQVFINIINNARDALVEKQIKSPKIEFDLRCENSKAIFTISDNAGGIPDHILPRIFEPYFTTKHKSQGTGLGLHMSYKIITESHKGRLYAQNIDDGARFTVEIDLLPHQLNR